MNQVIQNEGTTAAIGIYDAETGEVGSRRANIKVVNQTRRDIRDFDRLFDECYRTRVLPEALAGSFRVSFLDGINPDGTTRMVVHDRPNG